MSNIDNNESVSNARILIKTILKQTLDNPDNPESLDFFQADTYRFYFLMSFMWEYLEGNEISQEYAISLVPKKYASRIKRLQVDQEQTPPQLFLICPGLTKFELDH